MDHSVIEGKWVFKKRELINPPVYNHSRMLSPRIVFLLCYSHRLTAFQDSVQLAMASAWSIMAKVSCSVLEYVVSPHSSPSAILQQQPHPGHPFSATQSTTPKVMEVAIAEVQALNSFLAHQSKCWRRLLEGIASWKWHQSRWSCFVLVSIEMHSVGWSCVKEVPPSLSSPSLGPTSLAPASKIQRTASDMVLPCAHCMHLPKLMDKLLCWIVCSWSRWAKYSAIVEWGPPASISNSCWSVTALFCYFCLFQVAK